MRQVANFLMMQSLNLWISRFDEESEVHISDIALPSFDAFLLLILATIKTSDEQCFYIIETEEGSVSSYGYRLPNLTFVRKEITL